MTITCLIKKEGSQYASLCVELDVASCGKSKTEALDGNPPPLWEESAGGAGILPAPRRKIIAKQRGINYVDCKDARGENSIIKAC